MKKILLSSSLLILTTSVVADELSCRIGELCVVGNPENGIPQYKYNVLSKNNKLYLPISLKDEPGDGVLLVKTKSGEHEIKFTKVSYHKTLDVSGNEQEKWTPEQARLAAKENTIIKAVITETPNVDSKSYPVFKPPLKDDYVYPCDGEVVSDYGVLRQYGKLMLPHGGIDYKCKDSVKVVMNGVVSYVGVTPIDNDYVVVVSHGQKVYSLYRHLTNVKVKQGDTLTYNDSLGTATNHLHFSIYIDGNNINPDSFIQYVYGD